MTPELVEASAAVATVFGAVITWLWRTASSVSKAHTTLAIFTSDVAALKTETRDLRDNHIRTDTTLQQVTQELSAISRKMDTFVQVAADAQVTRAIVERLERRVDRQADGEHDNG
jgi:hypothetical protein